MKLDYLLSALQSNENINLIKQEEGISKNFNRIIEFEIRGKTYQIEWWINVCYLKVDELTVVFDHINIDGCWPNQFKNNINFKCKEDTVAILPLEEYENMRIKNK